MYCCRAFGVDSAVFAVSCNCISCCMCTARHSHGNWYCILCIYLSVAPSTVRMDCAVMANLKWRIIDSVAKEGSYVCSLLAAILTHLLVMESLFLASASKCYLLFSVLIVC